MFYLFVEMYVLILACLIASGTCSEDPDLSFITDYDEEFLRMKPHKRTVEEVNLNDSYFNPLENYHNDADPAVEKDYPWIARVIHSRTKYIPHVCTAVCIDPAIFITAARCIFTLKVNITSIIYKWKRLHALVFVFPSEETKQLYDDIGIIVVQSKNVKGEWSTIKPFNIKRTDNTFAWFANFSKGNIKSRVVGYAAEKGLHKLMRPDQQYILTSLNIVVGLDICPQILSDRIILAFKVPCYYSCSINELMSHSEMCKKYHGVEGGAIYDKSTQQLMGVATWGPHTSRLELPVGFAFANSANFHKDLACARRIRDNNEMKITVGYYQALCG